MPGWSRRSAASCSVVILALFWCGACRTLANRVILHPSNHAKECPYTLWEIEGTNGEPTIETYVHTFGEGRNRPGVFLLAFTGNGSRAESTPYMVEETLRDALSESSDESLRIEVVAMQYPGYGQRAVGSADLREMATFGCRAYVATRERAGDKPVLLYGFSIGTTVALHIARTHEACPPDGLIIDRPPNLRRMILCQHGWWNAWLIALPVWFGVPDSADSQLNSRAIVDVPALFLLSSRDSAVKPAHQKSIAEAYGGPKRIVMSTTEHGNPFHADDPRQLFEGLRWLLQRATPRETPTAEQGSR